MRIWRTTVAVAIRAGTAAEARDILEGYVEPLAQDGGVVEVQAGPGWTEEPDAPDGAEDGPA